MAKNFGKFLLLTTVVAAAGAGVYYYLKNRDDLLLDYEDEDFDNDVPDDDASNRSYVSLQQDEASADTEDSGAEPFQKLSSLVSDAAEKAEEKVEEFFDEDDEAAEEK
ncbi:MAG: hypothetical protein J1E65_07250 [Lachnospiraceae bacterium]|nr:hypothetical protein [Lachnospiraceae bacterium]